MRKTFALISFAFLIFFVIYFSALTDKIYESNLKTDPAKNSYHGVLTVADTIKRTVAGARFGFINKAIYNYEKMFPDIRVELHELKYEDNSEIALKLSAGANHPDIMTYYVNNISIDDKYLNDQSFYISFTDDLSGYFSEQLKKGAYKALPVSYEVPAVLINADILKQLNVKIPKELNKNNFFSMLKDIDNAIGKGNIYTFDMYISSKNNIWQPFYINNDMTKISSLKHKRVDLFKEGSDNIISTFANSKTAVCIVPSSQIRTLQNMKDKGNSASFSVYALPYDETYICNITFYAAFIADDELKNYAILNFLKSLLTIETQMSLQDIMHLPVIDIKYDKYTYLNKLKYKNNCILLHLEHKEINNSYKDMIQSISNY